jgi:hypothetical protein
MPRYFWVSASIALLLMAIAALLIASRDTPPDDAFARQPFVMTYSVPADRGESIRDSLRTVLLVDHKSGQPLGQASLPMPGRLVVSAPAGMHSSIGRAIEALSEGEVAQATSQMRRAAVSLEIWLIGADFVDGSDDGALAPAKTALDEARDRFGFKGFRLLDRVMAVASENASVSVDGALLASSINVFPSDAGAVEVQVQLGIRAPADDGGFQESSFRSKVRLPDGQWQVIGLVPASGGSSPDRLLLMRQTPVGGSTAAAK